MSKRSRGVTDAAGAAADESFYVHARPNGCSTSFHIAVALAGSSQDAGRSYDDSEIFFMDRFPCKMEPLDPSDCDTTGGWESTATTNDQWLAFDFAKPVVLSELSIAQSCGRSGYNKKPIRMLLVQSKGIVDWRDGEKEWQTIYGTMLPQEPSHSMQHAVGFTKGCHIATVIIPPENRQPMNRVRLFFADGWPPPRGPEDCASWFSVAKVCFKGICTQERAPSRASEVDDDMDNDF